MLALPANNPMFASARADAPSSKSISASDRESLELDDEEVEGFDETLESLLQPPPLISEVAVVDPKLQSEDVGDNTARLTSGQLATTIPSQKPELGVVSHNLSSVTNVAPSDVAPLDVAIVGEVNPVNSQVSEIELPLTFTNSPAVSQSDISQVGDISATTSSSNIPGDIAANPELEVPQPVAEASLASVRHSEVTPAETRTSSDVADLSGDATSPTSEQEIVEPTESAETQLDSSDSTPKRELPTVKSPTADVAAPDASLEVSTKPASTEQNNAQAVQPELEPVSREQSAAVTGGTSKLTTGVTTTPVPNQISDHILTAKQTLKDGKAKLEIQLDPPELGKITIELTESQEKLSAKVSVVETTTLDSIKHSLPSMIDALADAGISLDNFQLESSGSDDSPPPENSTTDFDFDSESREPERQPVSQASGAVTRRLSIDILV